MVHSRGTRGSGTSIVQEEMKYLALEISSEAAIVIAESKELKNLLSNTLEVRRKKLYYFEEDIEGGGEGSDIGKGTGVFPQPMSDAWLVFRNFSFIDNNRHHKVVYQYVKKKIEEMSKVLEIKRSRLVSGKTEIYTLLSMYFAMQVALLAFSGTSSRMTCEMVWSPIVVSGIASVAIVLRIWKLSFDISDVDEAMDGDTKDYRALVTLANAMERRGPAFKYSKDLKNEEEENDLEKNRIVDLRVSYGKKELDPRTSYDKKELEPCRGKWWMSKFRACGWWMWKWRRFIIRLMGCLALFGVGIVFLNSHWFILSC